MKKFIKIIAIIFVLIIGSLIVIPIVFKDSIVEMVKEEANNNLNAKVDFGEFDLSIFSNFPSLSFEINDVSVIGVDSFAGVELAKIGKLEASLDVMSVINGDQIQINTVGIDGLSVHAIVRKDSTANWDIAKPSTDTTTVEEKTEDTGDAKFSMKLKKFYLKDINVVYDDQLGGMHAEVLNLNHTLEGDFTQDIFDLTTQTDIDAVTVIMDGVKMMNKTKIGIKFDFGMDMPNSTYTFKENEFNLNELSLGFDGVVAMKGDDIDLDVSFKTNQNDFKNLLSMVPAVYLKDFETVKTAGSVKLDGMAKGVLNTDKNQLPKFELNLLVDNASFQYPDLPKAVDNIRVDTKVTNPGGSDDNTVIEVKEFHIEMAENPVDIALLLKTPVSDPDITCSINTKVNLDNVKDFIPVEEGESYAGSINADIDLGGKLSAIEQERYEDFKAEGKLMIIGVNYKSPSMGYDVMLDNMYMDFSPQYVDLTSFKAKIGKSDISASGKIDNLLAYYFKGDVLSGSFDMQSELLDLNELMGPEDTTAVAESTEAAATDTTASEGIAEVPANIDFRMNTDLKKVLYDNMTITNLNGKIDVKDAKADMTNLSMELLDGSMVMNGSYSTQEKLPVVDFKMDIKQFDLAKTVKTFNTVKKLAPVAENATGKFSTGLTFVGQLDGNMEPVMNSLAGGGLLTTHNVVVGGSKTLVKIADAVKNDKLKQLELNNVDIKFTFKDGKIDVEPFDVKFSKSVASVHGSHYFTNEIDYIMDVDADKDDLGGAGQLMESMMGQASAFGMSAKMPDRIKLKVGIKGTADEPKITTGFGDMAGSMKDQVTEQVKEQVKEAVTEKVEEVKEDVKAKAKEEAAKLIADAKKQAAKLNKEAASLSAKTKKEGYAAADKIVAEAKGPIAKIAAKKLAEKTRKETDKKAAKIVSEADKKGKALVAAAEKKAAELTK